MPFSFDWFLTIPGMLISFGVILLVIAFIMFLIGSSEPKKKRETMNADNNKTDNEIKDNVLEKVEEKEEQEENIVIDFSELDKKYTDNEISSPEVIEINNNDSEVVVEEPKTEESVKPLIIDEPKIEEIVKPIVVEEPEVVNIMPMDNQENVIDVASIEVKPFEEKHQIYGGADPLDATRELPKIDVHHVPYSGGKVEMPSPKVERIPDDFAFKPIVEDVKPVEVEVEKKQDDFKIEPMVDEAIYKFSTSVVEIPDDAEQL